MKNYLMCIGAEWGSRAFFDIVKRDTPQGKYESIDGQFKGADLDLRHLVPRAHPRYVFFLNWSWIVPKEVTGAYECVNFHCTELPFGRGGGPIENLIKLGRTETVITAHRMVGEVDAGPIYLRSDAQVLMQSAARPPNGGVVSLAVAKGEILARFVEPVASMIEFIIAVEPEPHPQVGEPTYFKRLPKDEYERLWAEREMER